MAKSCVVLLLVFMILCSNGVSSTSASPPAKIIRGVVANMASALFKWIWSLKSTTKTATFSRSMMKFEDGYTVATVFDGSKLGIEPYSVEVTPSGEYLVLDSKNSNIYKISSSLSLYSRPELIAGSSEGYTGHIDGKPRQARLNHPKGLAVDDSGNIYVADTLNMAIRKISDAGVTTIAGGKWGQVGGRVDVPSEDAKFSNDFDIVYIRSSCSLLVIDRGNQAVREIQLHDDDCTHHDDNSFHSGIAGLVASAFLGYMLAVLQRRVGAMFYFREDAKSPVKKYKPVAAYQRPPNSVWHPLNPLVDEYERSEESFFGSLGKLFLNSGSSAAEIFLGLFSSFRRKPVHYRLQQQYQSTSTKHANTWPAQDNLVIPYEYEPPPIESRIPGNKRSYPSVMKELEKPNQFKPNRVYTSRQNGDNPKEQQQIQQKQQNQYHQRYQSSSPQTYYEQSCETNEIVFGAVQEEDAQLENVVPEPVDYGDPMYSQQNIRPRLSYSHEYRT